ncbi:MAG: FAD-dependent oxidoreductase [Allorhizobium sp.]
MTRLVLVGGGHAHLIVLEELARRRDTAHDPSLDITLVTPSPWQYYSGMLPGWIMGKYSDDDCRVDLRPLAAKAGVRLILSPLSAMNADDNRLCLEDGQQLDYDLLSLDTGSETNVEWLESRSDRVLTVKPIEQFCQAWPVASKRLGENPSIVVVGGGAAGAELSIAMKSAWQAADRPCAVTLVTGNSGLLAGHNAIVQWLMRAALGAAGIRVLGERATGVEDGVLLPGGEVLEADLVIAATGARPSAYLAQSGLELGENGFVAVDRFHRSVSHQNVFAAGDVSARVDNSTTRSGVHAVRVGPILAHNLLAAARGQALRPYKPRRRSLYLLVSGPDRAVFSWGLLGAAGHWAWRWKDRIDRKFIARFRRKPA